MKIVVIGGSGLIGAKLVKILRDSGHEVLAASPRSGVNAVTGEGLAQAVAGAQVVVDVSNAPSWEDDAVLQFFQKSAENLSAAETAAGVGHHVALSVVGTDRMQQAGYFRAKQAQEDLVKSSVVPYTIVRATQFFEFVSGIAESGVDGEVVRMPTAELQPISADDVAAIVADVAVSPPRNGMLEIAGPDRIGLDELVRQLFQSKGDPRPVVTDDQARYFGSVVDSRSLTPDADARLGPTRFQDWLAT